jgi:pyruvate kinase
MILRRSKIVVTLGPSTDEPGILKKVLAAGADVVRINLSHGTRDAHEARISNTRAFALELGKEIGIMVDLQGPKLRISRFKEGFIDLKPGANFILDTNLDKEAGNTEIVGIDYKELPKDVQKGDILLLDDGLIMLEVTDVNHTQIHTVVKLGGKLSNNKGLNRRGGGLTANPLTPKDKEDILFAAKMNVDYVAVSFPRTAQDIKDTRVLLEQAGSFAGIIAKIERAEAVKDLDNIILSSDAVMVARGDLGVEIGYAELPGVQKHIIARARALDRAVITATQMMESMTHNPIPTRAEVSDVANAVIDGTDAVMLSAETASGGYPVQATAAMAEVCLAAERQRITKISNHRLECLFSRVDEAIAMATMYTANHIHAAAIIALTESGSTPLWMSRIRSGIPIYGLTRHKAARGRMTLFRGVYPIDFDVTHFPRGQVTEQALNELKKLNVIKTGDQIILTKGDVMGNMGGSNTMKILVV